MRIPSGKLDQLIFFVAVDATDLKTRETGLTTFTVYRSRNGGTATVYTTPTVAELSAANMPGVYSLLIDEDTTIASSSDSEEYCVHITQASMAPVTRVIELYRRDTTSGATLTVANGAGDADIERIQGTVIATPATAGILDVNVKNIDNDAASASGTVTFPNATLASQASVDVIDDFLDTEIAAIKAKTDNLPAAPAAVGDIPTAAVVADAVWDEDATGHQTQGTFGQAIGDPVADADTIWGLANANLNATVGSRASQTSVDTIDDFLDTEVAAIKAVTDVIPNAGALTTIQGDLDDIQARLPGALVSGRMDSSVGAMAAGTVTASAIATDAIDADAIASSAVTELRSLATGTADSGSTTTVVDTERTEADTDYWKGAWILFTSGTIVNQARIITGFNAATDTITFAPATTQAVGTNTYEIIPAARVDIQAWLGSLVNALISGRVDTSTGAMAANVVTAAAIAVDAIGASELAADAVTEIQSGLATAAALATVQADTDNIQTRLPAALVSGRMDSSVGAMAADVVTAAAIATDAIGSAELAASAVDKIVDQTWDELIAGHLGAGSTGLALNSAGAAGDPWATALPGAYGAGTAGKIVGDNVNVTISSRATQTSVDAVDDFVDTEVAAIKAVTDALPNGGALTTLQSDLDNIQTRLPAALISGRMDSSVGAMEAGVVTAAAIATDAIDGDALAVTAVSEIQSGLATAAALATVQADTDNIQARLPATLVVGRMDSSVGAMATDVITAAAIAADAVVEIQSGLATAAALAIVDDFVDTEVAAIKAKTDNLPASPAAVSDIPTALVVADQVWDEVVAGHVGAGSAGVALERIRKLTNNKVVVSMDELTVTVFEDNGTTVAFTFAISPDKLTRTPT